MKGECKNKPSNKDRKETIVAPITYPDAAEALLSLRVGQIVVL
jgi:hypothetical protein